MRYAPQSHVDLLTPESKERVWAACSASCMRAHIGWGEWMPLPRLHACMPRHAPLHARQAWERACIDAFETSGADGYTGVPDPWPVRKPTVRGNQSPPSVPVFGDLLRGNPHVCQLILSASAESARYVWYSSCAHGAAPGLSREEEEGEQICTACGKPGPWRRGPHHGPRRCPGAARCGRSPARRSGGRAGTAAQRPRCPRR